MKYIRLKYLALLTMHVLLFSSCQESEDPINYDSDDSIVAFIPTFPEVSSRSAIDYTSADVLLQYDKEFQITTFQPEIAEAGTLNPTDEEFLVTKRHDGIYRNDSCRWPDNRGVRDGKMIFCACFPTREVLRSQIGASESDFVLKNYSTKESSGNFTYDYRIGSYRIAKDISQQTDFLAATTFACKTENIYSGVRLVFEHQLSQVDFLAYNSEREFNVEIAAVKICNVMTQGDFCFGPALYAGKDDNTGGHWEYPSTYKKDTVEYIYRTGEKLLVLDGNGHTTKETATSIFGTAGHALLMPCRHDKWDHRTDPSNTKNGTYITVLLRVEKRSTGVQIYPDPGHKYGSGGVHYYLLNKNDGTISKKELKLYVKSSGPEGADRQIELGGDGKPVYYTNEACTSKYTAPDGYEVKELSWAAIPLKVDWKPGYRYTYYLDYSKSVGVHDPKDVDNKVAPNVINIGFDDRITTDGLSDPTTGAYTLTLVVGYRD